ncbi:hypothetical protein L9F63_009083, partial [Diploptera punctata]
SLQMIQATAQIPPTTVPSQQPNYQACLSTSPVHQQTNINRDQSSHQTPLHIPSNHHQSSVNLHQTPHHTINQHHSSLLSTTNLIQNASNSSVQHPPSQSSISHHHGPLVPVSQMQGSSQTMMNSATTSQTSSVLMQLNMSNHRTEPDNSQTVVSKLDLAEQKRKARINSLSSTGNNNVGSDSDGEDGPDALFTIWITKGPPAQLDASPGKLRFLRLFGLTTIAVRNEYELRKLERCRARSPLFPLQIDEASSDGNNNPPLPLDLPHPKGSPETLCKSSDFKGKQRFLKNLGLETVSKKEREESETIWQNVLAERLRRNSLNPVVMYCSQAINCTVKVEETTDGNNGPSNSCSSSAITMFEIAISWKHESYEIKIKKYETPLIPSFRFFYML